jgi:hypothetical protein
MQAGDAASVTAALALTKQGFRFAGALHFSSRPHGASFVTFDKAFVRRAKRAGVSAKLFPAFRGRLEAAGYPK